MGNAVKIAAKADMVIIADEVQHVVDMLIHAFYAGIAPVFFKKLPCKGNAGKSAVLCQCLNLFIVKVARVGAKSEIYQIMNELTEQGVSIIMISSDMEEIMGMADRILVMCEGKISGELHKGEYTQEKILEYAAEVKK